MTRILCEVCGRNSGSYLNLASHMVSNDLPTPGKPPGAHIRRLEEIMREPYISFAHRSVKRIAIVLEKYYSSR